MGVSARSVQKIIIHVKRDLPACLVMCHQNIKEAWTRNFSCDVGKSTLKCILHHFKFIWVRTWILKRLSIWHTKQYILRESRNTYYCALYIISLIQFLVQVVSAAPTSGVKQPGQYLTIHLCLVPKLRLHKYRLASSIACEENARTLMAVPSFHTGNKLHNIDSYNHGLTVQFAIK